MSSHTKAPRNKAGHGMFVKKAKPGQPNTDWGFEDDPEPHKLEKDGKTLKKSAVKEETLGEEEYDRIRDKWLEREGSSGTGSFSSSRRAAATRTSSHAVHVNGKKWKSFGSKGHATAVANKITAKNPTKKVSVHAESVEESSQMQESSHDKKEIKIVTKTKAPLKPEAQAHKDKVANMWANRKKRWDSWKKENPGEAAALASKKANMRALTKKLTKKEDVQLEGVSGLTPEDRARKERAALYTQKHGFKKLGAVNQGASKEKTYPSDAARMRAHRFAKEELLHDLISSLAEAIISANNGPKKAHSAEIMAQVAKDMAKRKAAHNKMLKGVKKEVDAQTKGKKPVTIHDPMDESALVELKRSTMASYVKKSIKSKERHAQQADTADYFGRIDDKKSERKIVRKRGKGIARALKKLAKEEVVVEGNPVNKAARNNHDVAIGKSAMQKTHMKAAANSGLLASVPAQKQAGRIASKMTGGGVGLSSKYKMKYFHQTAAGRSHMLRTGGAPVTKKSAS